MCYYGLNLLNTETIVRYTWFRIPSLVALLQRLGHSKLQDPRGILCRVGLSVSVSNYFAVPLPLQKHSPPIRSRATVTAMTQPCQFHPMCGCLPMNYLENLFVQIIIQYVCIVSVCAIYCVLHMCTAVLCVYYMINACANVLCYLETFTCMDFEFVQLLK